MRDVKKLQDPRDRSEDALRGPRIQGDHATRGRFVVMPAHLIRSRLAAAGFFRQTDVRGNEEVYDLRHTKDAHYVVRVYTSVRAGMDEARGCGGDAIRVVALRVEGNAVTPIFKSTRIHRTGTVEKVLDRMIERSREAYAACNEHRHKRRAEEQRAQESRGRLAKPSRALQPTEPKGVSLAEWRKALHDLLVRELGISDALDEKDPYNIRKAMGPAFQRGTSPAAFAGEHFEEEFEQQEDEVQELEGARMGELENL